jgi:hypothetical protein
MLDCTYALVLRTYARVGRPRSTPHVMRRSHVSETPRL